MHHQKILVRMFLVYFFIFRYASLFYVRKKTFTSLKDVPFSIDVIASDHREYSSRHMVPNLST
jgi:hypothetical protein